MWNYQSKEFDGKQIALGLDAREKGNYMRFINHKGPDCNAEAEYIPFNNLWYVYYIAVKDIAPGEEITTDYGSNYFDSRA
jgi:SET domain-containing protein